MRKRILIWAALFCFLFTGCSTAVNDEHAIKSAVSGYLDALQSADFEKAAGYCDASYNDSMGIQEFTSNMEAQLKEIDLGDDFNKAANDFIAAVMKNSIQSYEVKNYTQDGDKATVTVDLTGINLNKVDTQQAMQEAAQEYTEYVNDHMKELNELLNKEGEKAMKEELTRQLTEMLFRHLNEAIEKTPADTKTVGFQEVKTDGTWTLTSSYEQ